MSTTDVGTEILDLVFYRGDRTATEYQERVAAVTMRWRQDMTARLPATDDADLRERASDMASVLEAMNTGKLDVSRAIENAFLGYTEAILGELTKRGMLRAN